MPPASLLLPPPFSLQSPHHHFARLSASPAAAPATWPPPSRACRRALAVPSSSVAAAPFRPRPYLHACSRSIRSVRPSVACRPWRRDTWCCWHGRRTAHRLVGGLARPRAKTVAVVGVARGVWARRLIDRVARLGATRLSEETPVSRTRCATSQRRRPGGARPCHARFGARRVAVAAGRTGTAAAAAAAAAVLVATFFAAFRTGRASVRASRSQARPVHFDREREGGRVSTLHQWTYKYTAKEIIRVVSQLITPIEIEIDTERASVSIRVRAADHQLFRAH